MKLFKNRLLKRLLALTVMIAVGYFFYATLKQNWEAVQNIDLNFNWLSVGAITIFTAAIIISGYLWGVVLDRLTKGEGQVVPKLEAIRVHIASWLLKYVPGQAGSAITKINWATKQGYSKKIVLLSFIYENVFLLTASFILATPVLLGIVGGTIFFQRPEYTILPLSFLLLAGLVINRTSMSFLMNHFFSRIIKQSVDKKIFFTSQQSATLLLYFLLPRILNGIGFVLVVISFLPLDSAAYIPLAAAYILAGAVGILAVFVPSGIGVREAVIVLFASQFIPPEQAIVAAIIARLYATVADVGVAVCYAVLNVRKLRRHSIDDMN